MTDLPSLAQVTQAKGREIVRIGEPEVLYVDINSNRELYLHHLKVDKGMTFDEAINELESRCLAAAPPPSDHPNNNNNNGPPSPSLLSNLSAEERTKRDEEVMKRAKELRCGEILVQRNHTTNPLAVLILPQKVKKVVTAAGALPPLPPLTSSSSSSSSSPGEEAASSSAVTTSAPPANEANNTTTTRRAVLGSSSAYSRLAVKSLDDDDDDDDDGDDANPHAKSLRPYYPFRGMDFPCKTSRSRYDILNTYREPLNAAEARKVWTKCFDDSQDVSRCVRVAGRVFFFLAN